MAMRFSEPFRASRRMLPTAEDKRGVDLISGALPFGRLWYAEPNPISNAIGYAKHRGRSHDAVIHVYDAAPPVPLPKRSH